MDLTILPEGPPNGNQSSERNNAMKGILVSLLLAAAVVLPAAEKAPMSKKQVQALIQSATSAKDHQALSAYYRFEAQQLRQQAAQHEAMGAEYERNPAKAPLPKYPTMAQHCKDWAENYRQSAKKADLLAEMHAEMAKAAK